MKKLRYLAVATLLLVAVPTTTLSAANPDVEIPKPVKEMTAADWANYSHHLVQALNSDHPGLKESALRYAILYQDSVTLKGATISMMKIYRDSSDDGLRRLAVVALGSLDSPLVDGYLTRAAEFEKNPGIARTIRAVVAAG